MKEGEVEVERNLEVFEFVYGTWKARASFLAPDEPPTSGVDAWRQSE
jgi:hypothetical protein